MFTNDHQVYQELFEAVQMNRIFPDSKTFVDCVPKFPVAAINEKYSQEKELPAFDLKDFVFRHFSLPVPHSVHFQSNSEKPVEDNIERLWTALTRQPDTSNGSLIPLPYPYIVPGGRFGEIYYWDSYFTMLGLKAAGKKEMIRSMINNFSWLIENIGFIPNGNRQYFLSRSQPPFYSLMIKMLCDMEGNAVLKKYLPLLLKEYGFWMKGHETLGINSAGGHVVKLDKQTVLNRYWDSKDTPRPEAFREDVELANESTQPSHEVFRNLRAGAESGWDFSTRWFKDQSSFASIHTTDIVPVDLNCLLLHLEQMIAAGYTEEGEIEKAALYEQLAGSRKSAIHQYCWNEAAGFFVDYDWTLGQKRENLTLAGMMPLYLSLATGEQASKAAQIIEEKFLCPGGVITTLINSGQQWDAPNGWAPLQWITTRGLKNYGHHQLADEISRRWIQLNKDVFHRTGKLMEKYNVVDTHLEAGGGEYEGQDGFGWTNGVFLALQNS